MKRFFSVVLVTAASFFAASLAIAEPQADKAAADQEAEIKVALAELSPADRTLAEAQRFCVTMQHERLGAMGAPKKIMLNGQPVFLCCEGCEKKAKVDPKATLKAVEQMRKANVALARLSKEDRPLAEKQMLCPVAGSRLGSMGTPPKVLVQGKPVFLCCKGCERKPLANPQATLAKVAALLEDEEHE